MDALPVRHLADADLSAGDVALYVSQQRNLVATPLTAAHLEPVRRGERDLQAARERGGVYGLTTGVGALRQHVVDAATGPGTAEPDSHALRLWRSHAAGVGPVLEDGLALATMAVRLHQLLRGRSGASPGLVAGLARALDAGAVPTLRGYGGVGTGDLTVLAQLGLTLAGELPWRHVSIDPVPISHSDALPLLSSNAMTVTVAAVAVTGTARLARVAERVAALSHLALRGSLEAYDPRVHAGKNDRHAAGVAARLLRALAGAGAPARVQDPFGLRALPQVHAPLEEALSAAERAVTAEIGAAAENPSAIDGVALHHGQFLTQRLAASLDAVRAAIVPVLTLSAARLGSMLDPELNGVSAFLASGPAGSSGLMIAEYVAADILARVRDLSWPVTASRTMVSLGLEEHASHSTQSAWNTHALLPLVPDLLACELVAAVRCLRMAPNRLVPEGSRELFEQAHAALPDIREDHILGPELQVAAEVIGSW